MDNEEKLERILEVVEEDHKKIKTLYRAHVWGTLWKALYWFIIIGIAIGAFYFIQPYIDGIRGAVDAVQSL